MRKVFLLLATLPALALAAQTKIDPSMVSGRATGGTVSRTDADRFADVVNVKDYGAATTNTAAQNTTAFQAAWDATPAGGTLTGPPGTYAIDTLVAKSNTTFDMRQMVLSFAAHTTSHNPMIRIGTASAAATRVRILGGKIDGNASGQTFAGEEWSPGIMIWGSDYNTVEGVEITNTAGDGVTVGYDTGRLTGSNGNHVVGCEIYGQMAARQAVAITWGNENVISRNRITGNIDLEIDGTSNGACKNNLVEGNTGRTQSENATAPRISDLQILLASANTDPTRYGGNRVIGNSCKYIGLQYDKASIIQGNHVVGSDASAARLLAIDGSDETVVTGNTLVANAAVASSLTEVVRTRGGANLTVTGNIVANETLPFHAYVATFGASNALNHIFRDNTLTGTGAYRSASPERASEWALYRLDVTAGAKSLTQLAGVPVTTGEAVSSGNDVILSAFGGAGTKIKVRVWPQCSVTAANAATLDSLCVAKEVISGSNHTMSLFSAPTSAGAMSLTAFAGSTGTGTFFFEVWF